MLLATKICCRTFCPGVGLIWLPPLGLLAGNATPFLAHPAEMHAPLHQYLYACNCKFMHCAVNKANISAIECASAKFECVAQLWIIYSILWASGAVTLTRFVSIRCDSIRGDTMRVWSATNLITVAGGNHLDVGKRTQDPVPSTPNLFVHSFSRANCCPFS